MTAGAALLIGSRPFKDLRPPLLTYLGAYALTTVIGATVLLDGFGLRQFRIFLPDYHPETFRTLGSPLYWVLLLAPFMLIPIGAKVGAGLAALRPMSRWLDRVPDGDRRTAYVFYSIIALGVAWALYRLASSHNLVPVLLLDRSVSCQDRIVKRSELFGSLRYLYFVVAYAIVPMGTVVAMLRWRSTRRRLDLVALTLLLVLAIYLNGVVYMKANLLVLIGTLLLACVVSGIASWRHYALLGALGVVTFIAMELVLRCYAETPGPRAMAPAAPSAAQSRALEVPGVPQARTMLMSGFLRSPVFRMAASFPYYVEVFSDPAERCHVESNRLPLLPRERCYPATKIFPKMYPTVTFVQGFAPAPAHVWAFGEEGLGYALIVLFVGGLILGFLWRLSSFRQSPFFWAIGTAVCVFAYYLSQVSLVGALIYGHGLFWYLFPIVLALGGTSLCLRFTTTAGA